MIDYKIESADWLLPPDMEVVEYEIYYNENEVWKDICFTEDGIEYDFTGLYQISTYGNVKSLISKEKIKKAKINNKGYLIIGLNKNGESKKFRVHRLVAHMFLADTYFDGAEVNHIDENKANNHVSNLEWCTREYNCNYGNISKTIRQAMNAKLVDRFDLQGNLLETKYHSDYIKDGFCSSNITHCCKGRIKSHKNFVFKYHEE